MADTIHQIDLNADLGESFGAYTMGNDEEMMKNVFRIGPLCDSVACYLGVEGGFAVPAVFGSQSI